MDGLFAAEVSVKSSEGNSVLERLAAVNEHNRYFLAKAGFPIPVLLYVSLHQFELVSLCRREEDLFRLFAEMAAGPGVELDDHTSHG